MKWVVFFVVLGSIFGTMSASKNSRQGCPKLDATYYDKYYVSDLLDDIVDHRNIIIDLQDQEAIKNEQLNEYMRKEKNLEGKIEEIQKENQNLLTEKKDVNNKNEGLMNEIKKLSAQIESMKKDLVIAKPFFEKKIKIEEIVEAYRKKEKLEDDKKIIMEKACEKGDIEVVRALLDLGYVGVNDIVDGFFTGLFLAASRNRANVVSLLLDRGADVNLRETSFYGWTPLMQAAINGCLESAKVLVTRGADKYLSDNYKRTALSLARGNNKQDMIKLLVSEGAEE